MAGEGNDFVSGSVGDILSVIPFAEAADLTTKGLAYPLIHQGLRARARESAMCLKRSVYGSTSVRESACRPCGTVVENRG